MNKFLVFAVQVMAIGLLFSCGDNDSETGADVWERIAASSSSFVSSSFSSSSSSLQSGSVFCSHTAGCAEISAEACFAFGGQRVAFCPAISSSSLQAAVSSGSDIYNSSSSFNGGAGSSSSLPEVMVLCRLSDGTCPLVLISQEACGTFGGTPVQSCVGSSSSNAVLVSSSSAPPSSSSIAIAPSSSSSAPPSSSSIAASSSSAEPSSSSAEPSSSSKESPASSSSVPCTAIDNTQTQYCSEGIMKEYGFVTYGEQTYKTVVIGTQTWMAENLNYNPGTGNSICYDGQTSNCTTYGRLYDWSTAKTVCPTGWHLPSNADWDVMKAYINDDYTEGKKLKATSGWSSYNGVSGNGTDEYGFSALPGGYGGSDGDFYSSNYGAWWIATESYYDFAFVRYMGYEYRDVISSHNVKSNLLSVRCVQD